MLRNILMVGATLALVSSSAVYADAVKQTKGKYEDKFRQLEEILPTPNVYRNAAGEPGHAYWQQKVDYDIKASLDEAKRSITATEDITYTNNSPDTLKYLWLQLDQNIFKPDSIANVANNFGGIGRRGPAASSGDASRPARLSLGELRRQQYLTDKEVGYDIQAVTANGKALKHTIVGTLMRVDLPTPLKPGKST